MIIKKSFKENALDLVWRMLSRMGVWTKTEHSQLRARVDMLCMRGVYIPQL
jgi:hypothetical protein